MKAPGQPSSGHQRSSLPVPGSAHPLLEVEDLATHFPVRGGRSVRAVDGVSLTVAPGETLGLVGESGCGKSTLARSVVRLLEPTSGRITFDGRDITHLRERDLATVRRSLRIVFQDPYGSLNPRRSVGASIAQPLRIAGIPTPAARARVDELLDLVGLDPGFAGRLPHELSGGQRQRVGIARALALDARLVVLDEPVSSLDVSIRAQVLNLLNRLQRRLGVGYLFVSHDLSVVRHVSHRVAVMYLGRLVETGPVDQVHDRPQHPYTRALLSAVPVPEPRARDRRRRILLGGELPDPAAPPTGCRFRTRCWLATDRCAVEVPALEAVGPGHLVACHLAPFPDSGPAGPGAPAAGPQGDRPRGGPVTGVHR